MPMIEDQLQPYDKSSKWLIQHHGDSMLRLAVCSGWPRGRNGRSLAIRSEPNHFASFNFTFGFRSNFHVPREPHRTLQFAFNSFVTRLPFRLDVMGSNGRKPSVLNLP